MNIYICMNICSGTIKKYREFQFFKIHCEPSILHILHLSVQTFVISFLVLDFHCLQYKCLVCSQLKTITTVTSVWKLVKWSWCHRSIITTAVTWWFYCLKLYRTCLTEVSVCDHNTELLWQLHLFVTVTQQLQLLYDSAQLSGIHWGTCSEFPNFSSPTWLFLFTVMRRTPPSFSKKYIWFKRSFELLSWQQIHDKKRGQHILL